MTGWTEIAPSTLAAFLASLVECVEALTVVLAVGMVRGWRPALLGAFAAMLTLIVIVAVAGRSLTLIPLPIFRLFVGILLLLFGIRWLRKAVLRAAGRMPLHDETAIFENATHRLQADGRNGPSLDPVALSTAFKIVMLEGIEVAFIVVALGGGGSLAPPAAGAALAVIVVVLLGLVVHRPLARVPENTLKFVVGLLAVSFGTFWTGEGAGIAWAGGDLALLALLALFLAISLVAVRLLHRKVTSGTVCGNFDRS